MDTVDLETHPSRLTIERVSDLAHFHSIGKEWDDVMINYPSATVHLSHAWISNWWRVFGDEKEFCFLIARDDTKIIGAAPFIFDIYRRLGMKFPVIRLVGNELSPRSDIVLLRRPEEVVDLFFRELERKHWYLFDFGRTPESSPALQLLKGAHRDRFTRIKCRHVFDTPTIDLTWGWNTYLRSKTYNFRKTIKTTGKLLEEFSVVVFPHDFDDFDELLDVVRRVSKSSWQHREGSSLVSSPRTWEFYSSVMRDAFQNGNLLVVCVKDGGVPVCFYVCIRWGRTLYALKSGYNTDYSRFSPGTASLGVLVQFACEIGRAQTLDLDSVTTRGDYKYRWSTNITKVASYYFFGRHPFAAGLGWLYGGYKWLRQKYVY